jgi:hypothetical protein
MSHYSAEAAIQARCSGRSRFPLWIPLPVATRGPGSRSSSLTPRAGLLSHPPAQTCDRHLAIRGRSGTPGGDRIGDATADR